MSQKDELLVQVAELYYEQGMNQQQISEIFNISRSTVSRILEEARNRRIVEIIIHSPVAKDYELSAALYKKYDLKNCMVVKNGASKEDTLKRCAQTAADFLQSILENDSVIAVAWGSAIANLAKVLKKSGKSKMSVVQMVGCLASGNPQLDGVEVSMNIAQKLGASYYNIFAPAFVREELAENLMKEPSIAATLAKVKKADIAIMGIGAAGDPNTILSTTGSVSAAEWDSLLEQGAAGHLLARVFDENGNELKIPGKSVISPQLKDLRDFNWSVGISTGRIKAKATDAAIRAGYINTLVADAEIAQELIENY